MALHKTSLAVAVSMAISSGFMIATPAQAEGYAGGPFAQMMDDTGVSLELRNFYFNRDYKKKQFDGTNRKPDLVESWAQGARLDIESGYFMDTIGIDASWYGSLKLIGRDDEWGSGALRNSNPKNKVRNGVTYLEKDQKGYDKLGQVFLKTRFGDESLNAHINAGRMFLDTGLLNDSDVRVTPSTTQAIYADINWDDFTLYGFSSDKASSKTASGFHKYKGYSYTYSGTGGAPVQGKKMGDWKVNSVGACFDPGEGYGVDLQFARARDYKKMSYLNAYYVLDVSEDTSILFDGYYYRGRGDGKYLEKINHGGKLKKWDSDLWNLVAQFRVDDLKLAVSYQKVNGDKYDISWGGSDDNGFMTWNSVQVLDFNRRDEKSWMARIDYDFDGMGLPGLKFMTRYVTGEHHDQPASTSASQKTRNEWERDTDIGYSFQDGALKGLSVTFRNATIRTYGPGPASDGKPDSHNENRLIVNYTIALM